MRFQAGAHVLITRLAPWAIPDADGHNVAQNA